VSPSMLICKNKSFFSFENVTVNPWVIIVFNGFLLNVIKVVILKKIKLI